MKPRRLILMTFGAALAAIAASPALAWWQFAAYNPSGERKVYSRYSTEKACKEALKKVDAELGKKYPNLFPRVGSCEEYK